MTGLLRAEVHFNQWIEELHRPGIQTLGGKQYFAAFRTKGRSHISRMR